MRCYDWRVKGRQRTKSYVLCLYEQTYNWAQWFIRRDIVTPAPNTMHSKCLIYVYQRKQGKKSREHWRAWGMVHALWAKSPKCFIPLFLGILVKSRIPCWLLWPYFQDCFEGVMYLDLFSKSFFLTSKVRVLAFSFDCWSCSFYLRNPIGIFKLQFAPDKWLSHFFVLSMDSDF